MDEDFFYFKDFELRNRDTALKINTDGVLLASWANVENAIRLLDIGTAGGVIAFLLARRFPDTAITGIDIDEASILEAKFNKSINPTVGSKLEFYKESLQSFSARVEVSYDHIVSNPPFFEIDKSQKNANSAKQLAKHNYTLSMEELLSNCHKLLRHQGKLSIIIAYRNESDLEKICNEKGFRIVRKTVVAGKLSKAPNRILIELIKGEFINDVQSSNLAIRNEDGSYTQNYKSLTQDFYIKF